MDTQKYFDELDKLQEYMGMYIQLLPHLVEYGGMRLHRPYLPTLEYFNEFYDNPSYSLAKAHFKDSIVKYPSGTIAMYHGHGLGIPDGIKNRLCNYWMGIKFYTKNNVNGKYENTTP